MLGQPFAKSRFCLESKLCTKKAHYKTDDSKRSKFSFLWVTCPEKKESQKASGEEKSGGGKFIEWTSTIKRKWGPQIREKSNDQSTNLGFPFIVDRKCLDELRIEKTHSIKPRVRL